MKKPENNTRADTPNLLVNETSPYLLQHAFNPVKWHGWNQTSLDKAKAENKMMLISIGYSACHWCHVMEKESFENEEIAELMNQHFVCIKVDREERPDVDAVYMQAVQLIHGHGGWPLNCFTLSDGRPFYGATYFRPDDWQRLLENIVSLYQNNKTDLEDQAEKILAGMKEDFFGVNFNVKNNLDSDILNRAYQKLIKTFDKKNGGFNGAPKFPMPASLLFLTMFSFLKNDSETSKFLGFTLRKMASGGIYDQLRGGFARYSVDAEWKVPHFEKMLYDNAQLISLYSLFYQLTGKEEYLHITTETADFVLAELSSPEGFFYSALDADSEGEEGKFYVWTKHEFEEVLKEEANLMGEFFGIDKEGLWEDGKNILIKTSEPDVFTSKKNISQSEFASRLSASKNALLNHRNTRVRPGLDDKSLTSWNSLMISALAQLSVSTGNEKYYLSAKRATNHLLQNLTGPNGVVYHNFKNKAAIKGFLDDYAFFAEALLNLYEADFDERWLMAALEICEKTIDRFYDKKDGFFWFTDKENNDLVARKKEMTDNVIPSSNSTMAKVLFVMGRIFERTDFQQMSEKMLMGVSENISTYPSAFSHWGLVLMFQTENFYEIVATGRNSMATGKEILRLEYPAKYVLAAENQSLLPVFSNRFAQDKTLIYVCSGNQCQLPVGSVSEVRQLLVSQSLA